MSERIDEMALVVLLYMGGSQLWGDEFTVISVMFGAMGAIVGFVYWMGQC